MRVALYIAVVITVATASPSGYYHQDYNYKTSSSSYRNNELQHKTDDQGHYSKDGDLEGRLKPKVSSNSEHSEYINPKLHENANAGYYDAGADMMSQGNMMANSYGGSVGGAASTGYHSGSQFEDGVASSDYIRGAGYSGSSYSSGSGSAYESANLQSIGSRVQNDLQHELQSALISEAHHANIAELEADLRRNLSARLNQILLERFGTQTIRGGQSYSLNSGRLQARPNYDQQELDQLQRQMERSLLNELRQEYNYRTSHSSHSSHQNYEHYESTTTYRPSTYRPVYPSLNIIDSPDKYPAYGVKNSHQSQYNRVSSNIEYSQAPNVASITTIASNVQRDLNNQLNRLLEQAQRQYFSENSHQTATNLDQLRQQVRQNLTYTLEEELRRHFGTQFQRGGYMFTVGSGGESNQYNYRIADLDNLKRQVEENLITKLNRDFETARQHWVTTQQHSQSQQTHYGQSQIGTNDYSYGTSNNLRYEHSTPRYSEDYYYRPTAASIVPLISSGVKSNQYHGASGSHYSGYETSGSSNDFAQLERQLQADLSSQLQAALSQNQAHLSYSTMGGQASSSYDDAYRRLYEELQRNLTQQLQSFESGSSGYSSSYGGVSESQLAQLRSQLQSNLASQLQQGLRQSYSASASYSASSGSSASAGSNAYSSSNAGGYYRGTRGSDNYQYGQYRAGGGYAMEGEDCQGDDPSAHQHHRARRSYGGYSGYRSRPLGLSTHAGSGYSSGGTYGGNSGYGGYSSVGQEEDDSEIIQSGQRHVSANQGSQNIGQEIDDTDDTQQIEVDVGFTNGHLASGNQIHVGQEEDDSDGTQHMGLKPLYSGQSSSQIASGESKPRPSLPGNDRYITSSGRDNIQYTQTNQKPLYQATNFGLQGNSQSSQRGDIAQSSSYNHKYPVGQEEDDSDDTQQIEDNDFSSIGLGSQIKPKPSVTQSNQKPLNQATNFEVQGHLQSTHSSSNNNKYPVGQQEDDSDDTQQIEDSHFIGIGVGSQIKPKPTVSEFSQNSPSAERNIHTGYPNSYTINQMNHRQFNSGYQGNYKPSHSQIGYSGQTSNHGGQEEDYTDDTQQLEVDDDFNSNNENRQVNNFNMGKPLSQHTGSNRPSNGVAIQSSTPKTPSQNSFGLDIDDINMFPELPKVNTYPNKIETSSKPYLPSSGFQTPSTPSIPNLHFTYPNKIETSSKPSLPSSGFQTASTPKTPKLNFATQNTLPEPENVEPLPNSWNRPGSPTAARPFLQKPTTGRPSIQTDDYVPRPSEPINTNVQNTKPAINQNTPTSVPQLNIPDQLKDIYFQLQANLSTQIEDIVKKDLPIVNYQNQLYKDSLYTLKESIKQQCQKLLEGGSYSYLNIQQQDVTVLEKYAEIYLVKTLNEQFKSSGYIREPISYQPEPQQPLDSFNSYNIPYNPQPNIQQLNVPAELKDVSNQLETKLTRQIEEIIKNELPYSTSQNQLYKDTLYTLRENITRECQELLKDRRYSSLNIRQIDLTVLEKYIEANLIQTLNDKFKSSGSVRETIVYQVVPQQPVQPFNYNGQNPGYRQKPQISSGSFLQREINFQSNHQYPSINRKPNEFAPVQFGDEPKPVNPINSGSLVNLNLFPQTSPQADVSSTPSSPVSQIQDSPQPGASQIPSSFQPNTYYDISKAEQEADLLIQNLRNKLQNRQNTSSITQQYQPKYKVIQVTLENITSEQLQLIRQIETDFSGVIAPAVQNKYASSNLGHGSKYELYQASLRELEQELKRNLSDIFNGRIGQNGENVNLKKYFTLVNQKFRYEQIPDVQKYLEIRLTKNIRVQLKSVYNIETTAEEDAYKIESNLNTEGYISQKPTRITGQTRVVRLENLTPTQVKIIEQIEQDINDQIENAIKLHISNLKKTQSSPMYYQQSLVALESELKNNITESIEQLCEPGLNQNSDLILKNFDQSKIHDVEQYLEIKLINKLREKIISYSSSESATNSQVSYHSSSSIHSSHGYNSYQSFNHDLGYSDETLDGGSEIQEGTSHLQHAGIPSTPLKQGSVKGGGTYSNHKNLETPDIEPQHVNPDAEILSETSGEITSNPDEPTTKAPWWKRFGNKVKKIVGKA